MFPVGCYCVCYPAAGFMGFKLRSSCYETSTLAPSHLLSPGFVWCCFRQSLSVQLKLTSDLPQTHDSPAADYPVLRLQACHRETFVRLQPGVECPFSPVKVPGQGWAAGPNTSCHRLGLGRCLFSQRASEMSPSQELIWGSEAES